MRCFSEIEILVRKKNVEEKTSEHVFFATKDNDAWIYWEKQQQQQQNHHNNRE